MVMTMSMRKIYREIARKYGTTPKEVRTEIQKMIDDDKPIEVNCHFCNSHYTFTVEELKQMLEVVRR